MNEFNLKKTGKSQYGFYLLIDDGTEKGKFMSCTEQVSGFLSKQVPCSIEIEEQGDKGLVTRVKVLGKTEEFQVERPGENYKPSETPYSKQNGVQTEIKAQFCTREAIRIIELHNQICSPEEQIKPTMNNILNQAKIVWNIVDSLVKDVI